MTRIYYDGEILWSLYGPCWIKLPVGIVFVFSKTMDYQERRDDYKVTGVLSNKTYTGLAVEVWLTTLSRGCCGLIVLQTIFAVVSAINPH